MNKDSNKKMEISSNSSMIELKAELLKKKKEYEEAKKQKLNTPPVKKTKTENPPLSTDHPIKDKSIAEEENLKRSRVALEAKSRLYEKLEKGKLLESDLKAQQRENLLVDFAWKGWNPEIQDFEFNDKEESENVLDLSCSDDKKILNFDQVLEMLKTDSNDDQWIEYEDEFSRLRVAKLGQLRQIHQDHLKVQKCLSSALYNHYDGDAEIRNKGVAFYQFDRDEQVRADQMRELKRLREETVEKRMRNLFIKEQRRILIENRLRKLKERRQNKEEVKGN